MSYGRSSSALPWPKIPPPRRCNRAVASSPDRQNKTPAPGNGWECWAGSVPADVAIVHLSRPMARSLGARNLQRHKEGRAQVIPQSITGEIEKIEIIPVDRA